MDVSNPVGRDPVSACIGLSAAGAVEGFRPADWSGSPPRGLGIPQKTVEVPERLVEPLAQVLDLSDALLAVGQQPIDPGEDDRTSADTFLAPALDFLGFLIGEHLYSEEKAKIAYHASGPRGSATAAGQWELLDQA
jgi:hypothetical protein